jgi:metal-responsive CopG/Arc/MetJ family transcriptional regulator
MMKTPVKKVTVSLPPDVIVFVDKTAKKRGVSRSKVISACLAETAERHLLAEMEEGYRLMAQEQQKIAEEAFDMQREIVPDWK